MNVQTGKRLGNVAKRNKSGKNAEIKFKIHQLGQQKLRPFAANPPTVFIGQRHPLLAVCVVKIADRTLHQRNPIKMRQLAGAAFFRIVGDNCRNIIFRRAAVGGELQQDFGVAAGAGHENRGARHGVSGTPDEKFPVQFRAFLFTCD